MTMPVSVMFPDRWDRITAGGMMSSLGSRKTVLSIAINSAATTNATSIKASAGTVYAVTASNINAAARFVKLYNLAAAPTVGTSVPAITIPIPAASEVSINLGPLGMRFGTGIALAITGAATDADTTAVAANEIKVMTSYI